MKNIIFITALLSLIAGSTAQANVPYSLNAVQGMDACKFHIESLYAQNYAEDVDLSFQREAGTSIRGGHFKYWINASAQINSERSPVRFLCEVTRTGELVELIEEDGRWSI
jgi:hypothetical protein